MRRPIKTRKDLEIASNHFLRRNSGYPLGATLTELDYLRGWKDEFSGDAFHEQYTPASAGVGTSVTLVNSAHGGWTRLNAGLANGNSAMLVLGNTLAPFYYMLDADNGYCIISRLRLHATTNIQAGVVTFEWTNQYRIFCGLRTDIHANNWIIRCLNAAGNSFTNTGVLADTNWHTHIMKVGPTTTGHRVDYFLDGGLIGTHTTNIYNGLLHPVLWCINRGGSGTDRIADFDNLIVFPR